MARTRTTAGTSLALPHPANVSLHIEACLWDPFAIVDNKYLHALVIGQVWKQFRRDEEISGRRQASQYGNL